MRLRSTPSLSRLLSLHHMQAPARAWLAALTVTEFNPDHGEEDGSAVETPAEGLARALSGLAHAPGSLEGVGVGEEDMLQHVWTTRPSERVVV